MDSRIALFTGGFYFLRHGETELNRLGLVAGATDVPLNATGAMQAHGAARSLARAGIDAIWCSPLIRARETARCVGAALNLDVTVIAELAERNWGALEGRPRELRVRGATPPGGESLDDFRARTLTGLARVAHSRAPLIVAHSGTFRVLSETLGLAVPATPVANSLPLLLRRDEAGGGAWISEAL